MADQTHECFEWRASQKEVKYGVSILRVSGKCRILKPGYSVELRRQAPQGINPRVCVLVVLAHKPLWRRGSSETVVKELEYSESTGAVYDSVLIMPDGVEVRVQRD
jgi:hypothetical protein